MGGTAQAILIQLVSSGYGIRLCSLPALLFAEGILGLIVIPAYDIRSSITYINMCGSSEYRNVLSSHLSQLFLRKESPQVLR